MSESSCNCSPPLFVFITAHISASAVLSDQYLSSQAVISDHHQIDLMAVTLFTWCFVLVFFPLPLPLPSFPLTPSYLLLLSNPLSLCLALIVYHYVSYAGNRITATGSYFGRSHCLSVNGGDMHNYISERERCARVQKALSSAALRQEFVSRVCE